MRSILAGLENKVVRLPGDVTAEIDDMTGEVTIIQGEAHAVVLTPEQMSELISWAVIYHLGYINGKIDEAETSGARCFECREPIKTGYVYRMTDGDIELCSRCHTDIKKSVQDLQQCYKCGNSTQGQQSYTVTCGRTLIEVCFKCFTEIFDGEFSAQTEIV